MGNGTAAVLEPTYRGYVGSTTDALILFEACLTGVLHHVPRRPHDRERSQLVRSGSVFIYEENASGIKRWTDGVTWSPSRILGNFLVYRELDKPFPPGEKKRAMKKGTRRPAPPTRAGEPYPRTHQESNGASGYSPTTPSAGPAAGGAGGGGSGGVGGGGGGGGAGGAVGERPQQSEIERALVGSLVDSYGFKEGGLVKKTMSVTVSGVTHHLVSYYMVDDVMRGALPTPSMVESLRYIRPRPELTTKQSFRAPIDDMEQSGMEETDPSQAFYGYRSTMGGGQGYGMPPPAAAGYYTLPPGAGYPQQPAPISGYPVGPSGMPTHPSQNPYMPSPASSTDIPPKTEEYSTYRGPAGQPSAYTAGFDPMSQQPMSHMPSGVSPAGGRPPPPVPAYRNPSFSSGRNIDPSAASTDPNVSAAPSSYPRPSFSLPTGPLDGGHSHQSQQHLDQRGNVGNANATFDPLGSRRDSGAVPASPYYNGADSRQQPSQQSPPPQPQSQQPPPPGQHQQQQQLPPPHPQQTPPQPSHQLPPPQPQQQPPQPQHPPSAHQPPPQHPPQGHYFVGGQGASPQSVYQPGQPPMPTWGTASGQQPL